HGQQIGLPGGNPVFTGSALALGAVAVTAAVVADAHMAALCIAATVYVPAHAHRTAPADGMERPHLPGVQPQGLHTGPMCVQHTGHFVFWTHQPLVAYSRSSGLKGAVRPHLATCR